MTERIIIEIDDSQLDSVLTRLQTVSTVSKQVTGSKNLNGGLISINRNLRVILGQLPGMSEVIQAYFRIRKEVVDIAGGVLTFDFITATIATAIILIRQAQQIRKQLDRDETRFMRFVMKNRQLTRKEFERDRVLQRYYLKGQP